MVGQCTRIYSINDAASLYSFILLDAKQMKIPSDKLVDAMCVHAQAWRAKFALVEEANHARDLIRDLKVKAQGHTIVKGVPHRNHSKEDRLLQVLYAINAGQVRLLEGEKSLHLCLLYTSPSPRDGLLSRMPSSA